jgi:hypothetical protein
VNHWIIFTSHQNKVVVDALEKLDHTPYYRYFEIEFQVSIYCYKYCTTQVGTQEIILCRPSLWLSFSGAKQSGQWWFGGMDATKIHVPRKFNVPQARKGEDFNCRRQHTHTHTHLCLLLVVCVQIVTNCELPANLHVMLRHQWAVYWVLQYDITHKDTPNPDLRETRKESIRLEVNPLYAYVIVTNNRQSHPCVWISIGYSSV